MPDFGDWLQTFFCFIRLFTLQHCTMFTNLIVLSVILVLPSVFELPSLLHIGQCLQVLLFYYYL